MIINSTKRSKTEFSVLHAYHGDCILIKTYDADGNEFVILIDGGTAQTFRYTLKEELKTISHINLLILTHIDSDHIAGLINLFNNSMIAEVRIDEIWMNNPDLVEVSTGELITWKQGDTLLNLIRKKKPEVKITQITTENEIINKNGIEFTILSPTVEIVTELHNRWEELRESKKKDNKTNVSSFENSYTTSLRDLSKVPFVPDKSIKDDIFNSASISFLLKCFDISLLLLADSRPEIIIQSLRARAFSEEKPLTVDYVKVSHHGSLNNTSQELLSLIKSKNYIISTNGGTHRKHPSRETISRIVYNSNRDNERLNMFFNYDLEYLKSRIGDFIHTADFEDGNWSVSNQNKF